MRFLLPLLLASSTLPLMAAQPAAATQPTTPPTEAILTDTGTTTRQQEASLTLHLMNNSAQEQAVDLPERLAATLRLPDGTTSKVQLDRAAETPATTRIAPQGFVRADYLLPLQTLPGNTLPEGTQLSVPGWTPTPLVLAARTAAPAQLAQATASPATAPPAKEPPPEPAPLSLDVAAPPEDQSPINHFLENFSPYGPVYAVYGPSKTSQARLQFGFKYQLFGSSTRKRKLAGWEQGLYFGYTQRMFWDLGATSSPFRNIDYQPELFYLMPVQHDSDSKALSIQAGIRHESNGRDGPQSRSYNSLYVAPMASVVLNPDLYLRVSPRLSMRVGKKTDNPDIMAYRGHFGLDVDIGDPDGLQLATSTRFNPVKGRGAISADLSYPLSHLIPKAPDVYIFGQSFVGHGENLLDYRNRTVRFRIGFAIIR